MINKQRAVVFAISLFAVIGFLVYSDVTKTKDPSWQRGDELVMNDKFPDKYRTFYRGCKINYIAGQATSDGNKIWVLLTKCQNASFQEKFITDEFDRDVVDKIAPRE